MAHDLNEWRFKRGLDTNFMEQLKLVAKSKERRWFAEVLADPELILGIRKNYMNVYRHGQRLFKIERVGETGPLKFSSHPKYLVNPDLNKAVPFDGSVFKVEALEPLLKKYADINTLDRMKRAAKLYRGDEKNGLQAVVLANPNVLDTEIAFSREAEMKIDAEVAFRPETKVKKRRSAPRIDLACLEEFTGSIQLCFWEAKLYTNGELRARDTEARVVGQVRCYQTLVNKHRKEIVESYDVVARNLIEMVSWVDSRRKVGELIKRVAGGEPLVIDEPPIVGLIVYGFDEDQKKSKRWKAHLEKLEAHMPVQHAGDAKNIGKLSARATARAARRTKA